MTYLTYAALPEEVDAGEVRESFASIEYMDAVLSKANAESRAQSLAALLLLAKTLELAGANSKALTLCRAENGRPYAKDRNDLDFSLSHTRNAVACAVMTGKNARVGVDIEKTPAEKRAESVAKRFFSEKEREEQTDFAEVWTKKEALYKYLNDPKKTISELDTADRETERFDTIDTEYGKISICRDKNASEKAEIIKIILKS